MKKNIYIVLLFIHFTSRASVPDKTFLTGRVTDKNSGEALIGATIYISDLKTGAITDSSGIYRIENLPKAKFIIQVRSLGYATITEMIDLSAVTEKNFEMQVASIEGSEVVITGSAFTTDNARNSISVVPIDKIQLISVASDNIVATLAKTPGVSQITTGNGISKPVIRGLGYNRIVVINEGVRQEGQQWGDEHGIEIDQFAADRIEILKGPSSLLYGSDALGGVINILEPLPAPAGKIRGEISSHFSANNLLTANSLMFEGNQKGFIWRMRGTYKNSATYKTPVEQVYNSAFNEMNGQATVGVNKSWGYSHVHFSRWESNIGLVEGERDSATGEFINAEENIVSDSDLKSRKLFLPNQNIRHTKATSVNNFIIGKSQLRFNLGWQQNDRREFEDSENIPSLFFHLNTITYDVKYFFQERNNFELVIGGGGMKQENENKGDEFLVPDYDLVDAGGFASIKKSWDKTTLNAGVRFDSRNVKGKELVEDAIPLFAGFNSTFSAITGSIGATHRLSRIFNLKTNIGRGFRTPNISELSANGVHEGTFRYEIGDTELKPETSLQFDAAVIAEGEKWSVEIDGFYNRIDNFVYYRNIDDETIDVDGEPFPVYRYVQGNSSLYGFEFISDFHVIHNLHFENNVSYVRGTNDETGVPLPFIPAAKIENELKYEFTTGKTSPLQNFYVKASIENYLKQNRFDIFETATAGYFLLNAGIGTDIKLGKQTAMFFINLNNLTDKKYYDHLSRFKEAGIYNMGRNITAGLNVPFGVK